MALKAQVIGYMEADATRQQVNTHVVTKFAVAHYEYNKTANTTETVWINVSAWGISDAFFAMLQKGCMVHVYGELSVFSKKDGSIGISISSNKIDFLSKPPGQIKINETAKPLSNESNSYNDKQNAKENLQSNLSGNMKQDLGALKEIATMPMYSKDDLPF